ncbi:hypothetical protein C4561_01505 [candidate division WWE3 bacterium]|uniref:Uncharacterized protein n=1 Tax=candidate division WWE3 bacterium TaxID=2053526 RepID=A0A3A4ZF24_UNCKA|nr:MAG: hypothetical protein C4561_01505 [candidate division WWE3 bacterium]
MTCIVGLKTDVGTFMGGDSCATDGTELVIRKDAKIFKLGRSILVGYCGSPRMGQVLRYQLKIPRRPVKMDALDFMVKFFVEKVRYALHLAGMLKDQSSNDSVEGNVLIGYRGRLFVIDSDFQVAEPDAEFYCIGTGAMVANGSLFTTASCGMSPEERIMLSLEAAEKYCVGVARPFKIEVLR